MTQGSELTAFLHEHGFDLELLEQPREHGLTPLMRAAWLGRLDVIELLLARRVQLQTRNPDGNNALWLGCVSNRPDVVSRLIAAGVDLDNQNETGATSLMYAASSGKDAIVRLLLDAGANPHLRNQDDAKAVDMAATLGSLTLLRHTAR